jgi:hypothetical protein
VETYYIVEDFFHLWILAERLMATMAWDGDSEFNGAVEGASTFDLTGNVTLPSAGRVKSADKVTLVEAVNCAILNATLCHSINLVSLSWDVSVCCLLWDRGYMRNFQCGSSTSSFNSLACESHITTSQSFEEVYSYSSGLVDFCTIVFCFGTERKRLWNFELRENQGSTHSHYLSILFLRC